MGAAALASRGLSAPAKGVAAQYAERLLGQLGVGARTPVAAPAEHPAVAWARSGLMALTGARDGAPLLLPTPLPSCADGALAALASLGPAGALQGLRGAQLLGERAAIAGYSRNGAVSPGGSCRLLAAADGVLALNLARDEDWAALPAWLESEVAPDWSAVASKVRERGADELVARARELGLAAAREAGPPVEGPWCHVARGAGRAPLAARPRVVDLSSLWAGPLCGDLLRRLGADVIKVESRARPDGARQGPRAFFDLLNAGKACVALDFASAEGRAALRALMASADIVIEGSRPRALRQLGIDAEALVHERPGLTWLSITAYGRSPEREHWIGYGDDVAVAAGTSALARAVTGASMMVGDAIADPLTGLHAALAAWACHLSGGGLVSVAMREVVAHALAFQSPTDPAALRERQAEWLAALRASGREAERPRLRALAGLRVQAADTAA